jgi:hypothetical protein
MAEQPSAGAQQSQISGRRRIREEANRRKSQEDKTTTWGRDLSQLEPSKKWFCAHPRYGDAGSGRVVDFDIVQKTNASRRGNYQGSGNRMKI